MVLRARRPPRECDTGVCLMDITLAMLEDGFFDPKFGHYIKLWNSRSGELLGIVKPAFNDNYSAVQFSIPQEIALSTEELLVEFNTKVTLGEEKLQVDFKAIFNTEGVFFP